MLFSIDPASAVSIYDQLAADIRRQVISGDLRSGTRLPAARELAGSLDINVHTVLRAYQALRDEGFIDLRRGRGATIARRGADYTQLTRDIARVVSEAKRLDLSAGALGALVRKAYE
jgi:GntR family transcriptional regulator